MSRSPIPAHRWILNLLRAGHIAGLIGVGAHILAGEPLAHDAFAWLLLGSGGAMVLIDAIANPLYLRQIAGLWVVLKLAIVGWLVADPAHAPVIFWSLLTLSVMVAHAPAKFRHRVVLGRVPA